MNLRVFAFVVLAVFPLVASGQSLGWNVAKRAIRHEFPEVPRITTQELAAWLGESARSKPLLLDTRTRAEYDVSHLPGAEFAGSETEFDLMRQPKERPIVAYCSVGYRSAKFVRTLRAAGFTNVRNLEGSIFQWANEGRPLECDGHVVTEVHPYNRTWGLLLKKEHRAKIASVDAQEAIP